VGLAAAIATVYHYGNVAAFGYTGHSRGGAIGLAILLIRRYLRTLHYGFTDAVDEEPPLELPRHGGPLTTVQGTSTAAVPANRPTTLLAKTGDFMAVEPVKAIDLYAFYSISISLLMSRSCKQIPSGSAC